ncbi:helix-turn-helix transcriptional regulator [Cohnella fermenti]|uniref:Helix-turn-helix transcriptional regulator n=1 Tax=Cohnella fermenti TaxID=2565925 RepID=A0A4S4BHT4_9BACL|nr:AraC family transcriptional regulator [Cohnella fermenti]THF74135.1 helix-turn-helix transcriptional regulator [Cohnella fermenti]
MDHYEIVEQALIHIENRLDRPLSLDSVANASNTSKFYFHRLFSAMMGCSLNQYILSRRLNASLALVQAGELPLTDIAIRLGFGTPSSFTRAFSRQYGTAPSLLRTRNPGLRPSPVPHVVRRPIKNINGDVVTGFTLTEFESIRLCGIVFEVDMETNYRETIHSHSHLLLQELDRTVQGPCYVVYSNCQPGSTRFKALFGIPQDIRIEKPFYFTVDVPSFFCAKFTYAGDLLDIGDVLKTDYARFLKIARQETDESPIELVQRFDDVRDLQSSYHIFAPIRRLPIDSDEE